MLNKFVLEQLIAFFQKNPVAQGKPTTDDEILNIEKALNIKLDDDFKEFTMRFGGCVVRDTQIYGIQRSLNEQIHSQLKVPAEVLRTKNDKDYSFTLMIRTDSQGRITSVELDSNENISNDEIYSKLVQSAKDTVWNIGYIDVKEDLVIYVPFHFIISSKDDVN